MSGCYVQYLDVAEDSGRGYDGGVGVPTFAGTNAGKHIRADCWVMHVCADGYTAEERDDIKRECITHGIYIR